MHSCLLDLRGGLAVGSILHLLIALLGLGGLLSLPFLLFGLLAGLLLGPPLSSGLLLDLSAGLLFLLTLVVEALDDRPSGSTKLFQLGDVLCLGCIVTVIIEPVLFDC